MKEFFSRPLPQTVPSSKPVFFAFLLTKKEMLKEIRPVGKDRGGFPRPPRRNHPSAPHAARRLDLSLACPSICRPGQRRRTVFAIVGPTDSGLGRMRRILRTEFFTSIPRVSRPSMPSRAEVADCVRNSGSGLARAGLLWPVSVRRDVASGMLCTPRGGTPHPVPSSQRPHPGPLAPPNISPASPTARVRPGAAAPPPAEPKILSSAERT